MRTHYRLPNDAFRGAAHCASRHASGRETTVMSLQSSSSFRRNGQRDDRRRRLLTDELANSDDQHACRVWPEDAPPRPKSEHYGDADFLDQQLRLLDLIPRGLVAFTVLPITATAILVGLEFAYAWMVQRVAGGGTLVAALDLAAKGSLACWFSSLMLLAASVAALLVYAVRRHRTDDYQGRYRIWLWAAACWFLWPAIKRQASAKGSAISWSP